MSDNILTKESLDIIINAVKKRCEKSEVAVLRDYFAQHDIEGEDVDKAKKEYEEYKERVNAHLTDTSFENAYLKGQCEGLKYCFKCLVTDHVKEIVF